MNGSRSDDLDWMPPTGSTKPRRSTRRITKGSKSDKRRTSKGRKSASNSISSRSSLHTSESAPAMNGLRPDELDWMPPTATTSFRQSIQQTVKESKAPVQRVITPSSSLSRSEISTPQHLKWVKPARAEALLNGTDPETPSSRTESEPGTPQWMKRFQVSGSKSSAVLPMAPSLNGGGDHESNARQFLLSNSSNAEPSSVGKYNKHKETNSALSSNGFVSGISRGRPSAPISASGGVGAPIRPKSQPVKSVAASTAPIRPVVKPQKQEAVVEASQIPPWMKKLKAKAKGQIVEEKPTGTPPWKRKERLKKEHMKQLQESLVAQNIRAESTDEDSLEPSSDGSAKSSEEREGGNIREWKNQIKKMNFKKAHVVSAQGRAPQIVTSLRKGDLSLIEREGEVTDLHISRHSERSRSPQKPISKAKHEAVQAEGAEVLVSDETSPRGDVSTSIIETEGMEEDAAALFFGFDKGDETENGSSNVENYSPGKRSSSDSVSVDNSAAELFGMLGLSPKEDDDEKNSEKSADSVGMDNSAAELFGMLGLSPKEDDDAKSSEKNDDSASVDNSAAELFGMLGLSPDDDHSSGSNDSNSDDKKTPSQTLASASVSQKKKPFLDNSDSDEDSDDESKRHKKGAIASLNLDSSKKKSFLDDSESDSDSEAVPVPEPLLTSQYPKQNQFLDDSDSDSDDDTMKGMKAKVLIQGMTQGLDPSSAKRSASRDNSDSDSDSDSTSSSSSSSSGSSSGSDSSSSSSSSSGSDSSVARAEKTGKAKAAKKVKEEQEKVEKEMTKKKRIEIEVKEEAEKRAKEEAEKVKKAEMEAARIRSIELKAKADLVFSEDKPEKKTKEDSKEMKRKKKKKERVEGKAPEKTDKKKGGKKKLGKKGKVDVSEKDEEKKGVKKKSKDSKPRRSRSKSRDPFDENAFSGDLFALPKAKGKSKQRKNNSFTEKFVVDDQLGSPPVKDKKKQDESKAKSFNYDDLDIWADDPYAKYDDEPFEEEVAAIEVTKKKEKKRKKKKDSSKPNSKKKLVPFEGYDMDSDDKWFDADFSNFA